MDKQKKRQQISDCLLEEYEPLLVHKLEAKALEEFYKDGFSGKNKRNKDIPYYISATMIPINKNEDKNIPIKLWSGTIGIVLKKDKVLEFGGYLNRTVTFGLKPKIYKKSERKLDSNHGNKPEAPENPRSNNRNTLYDKYDIATNEYIDNPTTEQALRNMLLAIVVKYTEEIDRIKNGKEIKTSRIDKNKRMQFNEILIWPKDKNIKEAIESIFIDLDNLSQESKKEIDSLKIFLSKYSKSKTVGLYIPGKKIIQAPLSVLDEIKLLNPKDTEKLTKIYDKTKKKNEEELLEYKKAIKISKIYLSEKSRRTKDFLIEGLKKIKPTQTPQK